MFSTLVLGVKDLASSALQKIEGGIGAISKASTSLGGIANKSFGGLTGATAIASGGITTLTSKVSLLDNAVTGIAFGAAVTGFGLITSAAQQGLNAIEGQFGKARELQQTFVGNASSLAAQTGRSFDESNSVITAISTEITNQAAALPGLTQNYKDLSNTLQGILIRGFVDKKGNVDFAGFGKSVEGLSLNYEALSAGKNVNTGATQGFLQRALAGGSIAELSQLEFGIRSPEVIQALKTELKKQGLTELSQVRGLAQKSNILVGAAAPFISDDFKSRSANTVEGVSRGFETKLFDQRIGTFGLLRSVNDEGTGIKTAIEAYTKFLSVTIGEKGLFTKLGDLAKTLGIFVDPMQVLHDGFLLFTEAVLIVDSALDKATNIIKGGGGIFKGVQTFFTSIAEDVAKDLGIQTPSFDTGSIFQNIGNSVSGLLSSAGTTVSNLINQMTPIIGNALSSAWGAIAGVFQGITPIINAVLSQASNFLGSINFGAIGSVAGDIFVKIVSGLSSFVQGIDWGSLLSGAGNLLAGVVVFGFKFIDKSITSLTGILTNITNNAISELNNLMGGVGGKFDEKAMIIAIQIGAGVGKMWGALNNYVRSVDWVGLTLAVGHIILVAGEVLIGLGIGFVAGFYEETSKSMSKTWTRIGDSIGNAWNGLISSLVNGINDIKNWLGNFVTNLITQGKNNLKAALNFPTEQVVGQAITNTGTTASNWIGDRVNDVANFFGMGAKYSGNIPTAANGLFGAASTESSRMPLGANLVMANDKEFILAPARRPISSAVGSGNSGSGMVVNHAGNSFTININGAVGDMKAIADEVIAAIQSRIDGELMAQL